jgi:putative ABC transport system permease protein
MFDVFVTSTELGLLFGLVALGLFVSFKILRFPDLTVDGSFVSGAAATALTIRIGLDGGTALLCGLGAGLVAGGLTAILHVGFKINKILAGILSLGILYSINLRLMHGPNLSLLNQERVLKVFDAPLNDFFVISLLIAVYFAAKFAVDWFLQTKIGLQLRATGDSESTARSLGVNTNTSKIIGIVIANGFVGLAGGLVAQYQGFADIGMGTGTIVLGLAALLLGEVLITRKKIPLATLAVVVGSIAYQIVINVALRLGLPGTDLKLVTALLVIGAFVLTHKRNLDYAKRLFAS